MMYIAIRKVNTKMLYVMYRFFHGNNKFQNVLMLRGLCVKARIHIETKSAYSYRIVKIALLIQCIKEDLHRPGKQAVNSCLYALHNIEDDLIAGFSFGIVVHAWK